MHRLESRGGLPGFRGRCRSAKMSNGGWSVRLSPTALFFVAAFAFPSSKAYSDQGEIDRRKSFQKALRITIFRDRVDLRWSDDESKCWYRVQIADQRWEYVSIDMATGQRRAAIRFKVWSCPTSPPYALPNRRSRRSSRSSMVMLHALLLKTGFKSRSSYSGSTLPGKRSLTAPWKPAAKKRRTLTKVMYGRFDSFDDGDVLATLEAAFHDRKLIVDGPGKSQKEPPSHSSHVSPDGRWRVEIQKKQFDPTRSQRTSPRGDIPS